MENLNEALSDLRDRITEDGFRAGLVAHVASDWEINPVLLERKFVEKFGRAPAEYTALTRDALRNLAIELAMKEAVAYSERFYGGTPVVGKPFTHEGEEYIAVAVAVGGLRAVQVSNGRRWVFGHSGKDALYNARRFGLI